MAPLWLGVVLLAAATASWGAAPAKLPPIPPIPKNLQGALPPLDALPALPPSAAKPRAASKVRQERAPILAPAAAPQPSAVQAETPTSTPTAVRLTKPIAACNVAMPALPIRVAASGGTRMVEYRGEPGCVAAVSADEDWAHATLKSASRSVVISVDENPSTEARRASVYLVTSQASLELELEQAGAPVSKPSSLEPTRQVVAPAPPNPPAAVPVSPGVTSAAVAPFADGPPWEPVEAPAVVVAPLARETSGETAAFIDGPPWEPVEAPPVVEAPLTTATPQATPVFEDGPPLEPVDAPAVVEAPLTQEASAEPAPFMDGPPLEPVAPPNEAPSPVPQTEAASAASWKLWPGTALRGLLKRASDAIAPGETESASPRPATGKQPLPPAILEGYDELTDD